MRVPDPGDQRGVASDQVSVCDATNTGYDKLSTPVYVGVTRAGSSPGMGLICSARVVACSSGFVDFAFDQNECGNLLVAGWRAVDPNDNECELCDCDDTTWTPVATEPTWAPVTSSTTGEPGTSSSADPGTTV